MNDTDGLAAETRQLLDAATELTAEWYIERTYNKRVPDHWSVDVLSDDDHVCSVRGGDEGAHALAALIAAAPRLLANWLARTEALGDYWGSVIFRLAAEVDRLRAEVHQWEMSDALQRDPDVQQQFIDTLTAERDRLADENRALREAILDAATELGLAHEPDWASDKAKADGKDPVWCRMCGPADGSWPCTSRMVLDDLLAAVAEGAEDR